MNYDDLPVRWKDEVGNYISKNGSEYSVKYKRLSASDFPCGESLKITFSDDSNAFFNYAFYLINEQTKEVAEFTERCGYHIFNLPEILTETVDWEGNIIKTDDFRTE